MQHHLALPRGARGGECGSPRLWKSPSPYPSPAGRGDKGAWPRRSLVFALRTWGGLYWGMPLDSTLLAWGALTPTAASLHEHHDKKQHHSYPESLHRTALILRSR